MMRLLCRTGETGASFGHNCLGIRRMYPLIGRTMNNNGANAAMRALETIRPLRRSCRGRGTAHGNKCRSHVSGAPKGEAGGAIGGNGLGYAGHLGTSVRLSARCAIFSPNPVLFIAFR